jgi:uncharacterized repeat protein (TIGR02543 family)
MKGILSWKRRHYVSRVGIFLIAVTLIAGMSGCGGGGPSGYDLIMAADPAAGGTVIDAAGGSPYGGGTAVSIKAEANPGYEFAGWTALAGGFADANAEETTFTMPSQDVTVTANFEPTALDHFKVYEFDYSIPPYVEEEVYLEDQFCALTATVGYASHFASPAEKIHGDVTTPILSPDHHFMVYLLDYEAEPQGRHVTVSNQFGDNQELIVSGPISLVVPTQVEGGEEPVGLDHYVLYEVVESDYDEEEVINVSLKDDLINEPAVYDVYQPLYFACPVRKTHGSEVTEISNPDVHAVIYQVWSEGEQLGTTVHIDNQFGHLDFDIYQDEWSMLAVPSEMIAWETIAPEIEDWYDLDAVRGDLGGTYLLMNDLDSTTPGYEELASPTANMGKGWDPIGFAYGDPFTGSFDGQGYEIRDLYINRPDEEHIGLFGYVDDGGVIENVGLVGVDVTSWDHVGGLVGDNGGGGTVNNCYTTGSVSGDSSVGGLAGGSSGIVTNSFSSSDVTGDPDSVMVGGLIGQNTWGSINGCYSTGDVIGRGSVGGLAGYSEDSTISNSYATGSVSGYSQVGGLVGWVYLYEEESVVSNSYSTGNVAGDVYVGGLVGLNEDGTVSNSFWDTETSGQATSDGGVGKTTAGMKSLSTFSGATWDIIGVSSGVTNPVYLWNIIDGDTYPFLSWQSVS